jgi:hypothetical protein
MLIILSWLSNRADISELRREIRDLRSEMHKEFREFYRTLGQHDAQLEILLKERK